MRYLPIWFDRKIERLWNETIWTEYGQDGPTWIGRLCTRFCSRKQASWSVSLSFHKEINGERITQYISQSSSEFSFFYNHHRHLHFFHWDSLIWTASEIIRLVFFRSKYIRIRKMSINYITKHVHKESQCYKYIVPCDVWMFLKYLNFKQKKNPRWIKVTLNFDEEKKSSYRLNQRRIEPRISLATRCSNLLFYQVEPFR